MIKMLFSNNPLIYPPWKNAPSSCYLFSENRRILVVRRLGG